MFGLNDVLQGKGTVLNSFIGRDMQDFLLLAKRKFGGAKIHYTGIYNTHAIDPMYALKICNDIYRKAVKDNTPGVSYINNWVWDVTRVDQMMWFTGAVIMQPKWHYTHLRNV